MHFHGSGTGRQPVRALHHWIIECAIGECAIRKAVQKLGQLATQLALTPEQKGQLMPILVAEAPKVKAIKADSSLTKIQKVQRLKALHDETDPQVKAILSPEQYEQLQRIRRQELSQIVERRRNQ